MADDSLTTTLERLYRTILERKEKGNPKESYTAALFAQGREKILRKLIEETGETVMEVIVGPPERVAEESADVLYHLLVVWAYAGIEPNDVYKVLVQRERPHAYKETDS